MDLPTQPLHPKIRLVWLVTSLGAAVVVSIAGFSAAAGAGLPAAVPTIGAVVLFVLASVVPVVAYRHWRYEIRTQDVFISKGFVFRTLALMPFDRIQFVETKQGPLDRWFGLTQLVIRTAGGQVSIPGLTEDESTLLRERLSAVVGTLSV